MGNTIAPEKMQIYKETRDVLIDLATLLDQVVKGETSQTKAMDTLGIARSHMSNTVQKKFRPYLSKMRLFEEILTPEFLKECQTPYEKLAHDIFGEDSKVIIMNYDMEQAMEEALKTLTEREQKVIRFLYGIDTGIPKYLDDAGKEFGVTRERIRQIKAKALRKLRHPDRVRMLLPECSEIIADIKELYPLCSQYESLKMQLVQLQERYEETAAIKATISHFEKDEILEATLISSVSHLLPDGWAAVLISDGINTIHDIKTVDSARIMELAYKNYLDPTDMYAFCFNCGFYEKKPAVPNDVMRTKIDELELSVRSYNCLKRANVNTVKDLCSLSPNDLKQIRNLGQKSYREITKLLLNRYGIDFLRNGDMPCIEGGDSQ